MAELVDAVDSKSTGFAAVRVRVPLPAPPDVALTKIGATHFFVLYGQSLVFLGVPVLFFYLR